MNLFKIEHTLAFKSPCKITDFRLPGKMTFKKMGVCVCTTKLFPCQTSCLALSSEIALKI